ncbi:glycosyltransferase [Bacillus sp. 71mf]|nr:glycosyltransferase [Bacillus sp. 71mf]
MPARKNRKAETAMLKLSLIVPTYNREKYLTKALLSFLNQSLSPDKYEILIIDNNSTDQTALTVRKIMESATVSWKYLKEMKQGLHYVRNKGILEAKGDIVIFGDDDIIASSNWLENIMQEFEQHPQTGICGGKIKPLWQSQPENWVYDYGSPEIHPLFAYLDYGDERVSLHHEYVFGCNFAIRRDLAIQIGGSFPDTFPTHLKHLSGTGENAMIDNTRKLNYEIIYLPEALVYHHIDSLRMTLNYFIDRYERWAVEDVFALFRKKEKKQAAAKLVQIALDRLSRLEMDSANKFNPEYYRIIHKRYAYQMIQQTVRVLTEPSLYHHISLVSYLEQP